MLIRPATVEDARGIAEVHVRGWQIGYVDLIPADYLARFSVEEREAVWRENELLNRDHRTLVAEDEGVILGFSGYGTPVDDLDEKVGEVLALYVDPAH